MSNETAASMIDRLITVDQKLWAAQDDIYRIRKMTFEEFKAEFFANEEGAKKIWQFLAKATDLNCQRAELVDSIDQKLVELVKAGLAGEDLDNGKFIQRKFKTY